MKYDKSDFKKSKKEINEWLKFKRRGPVVQLKKGRGSYRRKSKYAHSLVG